IELGMKALQALATSLEKEFTNKLETFQGELDQRIVKNRQDIIKVGKEIERVRTNRDASLAKLQEDVKKFKTEIQRVESKRDAKLAKLQEEITELNAEIALLKQRELELSREEENVRKNTDLLMAKRNSLIEDRETRNDPLGLVLYTTSLQQNIAYFNQLVNQLSDVKRTIENKVSSIKKREIERVRVKEEASLAIEKINSDIKKNQIESIRVKENASQSIKKLESDVLKIQATIKALEERKKFAKPIEVIQEPTVSYKPVRPKKRLNAAIAGILAFFISVFGAFLWEYIAGKKKETASATQEDTYT
ncbi:MAG: hypothetical protein JRJ26_20520, partial [Deltaproteobacteria bacterium]|nr:hypothetical protein [Deltaproteobacteria bacterium]